MRRLFVLLFLLSAAGAAWALQSDKQPDFADFRAMTWRGCDIDLSREMWKIDFRSCDLSNKDLSTLLDEKTTLQYINFDDKTIWPKGKKMPKWLSPSKMMEAGKTPGLDIKKLHKKGIIGKDIGIAIIDQSLGKHAEYQDRLRLYKDFDKRDSRASMHGAAVASIAVGKTIGVAPGADLYYISARFRDGENGRFNSGPAADAIKEIIEVNKTLPAGKRIAVISISRGFGDNDNNRKEFLAALASAEKNDIAVFMTDDVFTLSRAGYFADPDEISSYTQPAYWLEPRHITGVYASDICVPTDYRITASPTGYNDFVVYSEGGLSWGVPYIAGLYALAKQVNPQLTKDVFMAAARAAATQINFKKDGTDIKVNYFINPTALINKLKE